MFGLSPDTIAQGGLIIIGLIVFFESGVMVGFFLPGDTLLVTAGVATAAGQLSLPLVIAVTFLCAAVSDNIGYFIGHRAGPKLFTKEEAVVFKKSYADRSHHFFERHGSKMVLFARFVPIIRTFTPATAGISQMKYSHFAIFNAIGCALWATVFPLIGYFVGSRIPNIGIIMELLVVGVVAASLVPILIHVARTNKLRSFLRKIATYKLLRIRSRKTIKSDKPKARIRRTGTAMRNKLRRRKNQT